MVEPTKFDMLFSITGGVNVGDCQNVVEYSFIDVNNDGLPDLLCYKKSGI